MATDALRYCVLIPVYNQHHKLGQIVTEITNLGLACLLVDDGSDQATRECLAQLNVAGVQVYRLPRNQGKGVAVCHGIARAMERGFTHVVQIDADGQHKVADIQALILASQQAPDRVIAGARSYASMPTGRRRGRRFTDWWVNLNTLSRQIADSMCGLRVYPLHSTMALLQQSSVGARMEFDTDIAVQLYWAGVDFTNVPVTVVYPPENTSHFRLVADNARITWMHTRHFFHMLTKLPGWLLGRVSRGW